MLKEKGGTYFVVIILKTTTKKQSIEGDLEGRRLKGGLLMNRVILWDASERLWFLEEDIDSPQCSKCQKLDVCERKILVFFNFLILMIVSIMGCAKFAFSDSTIYWAKQCQPPKAFHINLNTEIISNAFLQLPLKVNTIISPLD